MPALIAGDPYSTPRTTAADRPDSARDRV